MSTKSEKTKDVEFEQRIIYTESRDHRYSYAQGALVGSTPKMEILLQLYQERYPLPKTWKRTFEKDGRILEPQISHSNNEIERIIHATISLNPAIALSVGKLLIEKSEEVINNIEKIMQEQDRHND